MSEQPQWCSVDQDDTVRHWGIVGGRPACHRDLSPLRSAGPVADMDSCVGFCSDCMEAVDSYPGGPPTTAIPATEEAWGFFFVEGGTGRTPHFGKLDGMAVCGNGVIEAIATPSDAPLNGFCCDCMCEISRRAATLREVVAIATPPDPGPPAPVVTPGCPYCDAGDIELTLDGKHELTVPCSPDSENRVVADLVARRVAECWEAAGMAIKREMTGDPDGDLVVSRCYRAFASVRPT